MLAKDVIKDARYTLSDLPRDRWTDDRLLSLLNDGLIDIAKNTTLFVETVFYPIADNVVDIDLSGSATKLIRAEYLDEPLPLYSFSEMDKKSPRWQLETGTAPKAIVYDNQRTGLYKLYPIVQNDYNPYIVYSSNFGIVTEISYSDIGPILANAIGDIAGISQAGLIKFYYVRRHTTITDINTTLRIDDLVKNALSKYISGFAFRDNQDTQNRALGNEELKFYYQFVEEYSIQKFLNTTKVDRQTSYNPMGS